MGVRKTNNFNQITAPVIFFDGLCNLCNASIRFIIKKDKKSTLKFASLQSEYAREVLPTDLTQKPTFRSVILLKDNKILFRSSAALTITRFLSGMWPLLYVFMIIPRFIRDFVYNVIARNRYKWFGKRDECMIPTPEIKERFID